VLFRSLAAFFLLALTAQAPAQGKGELTVAERRTVDRGGQVFRTEQVHGSPWPRAWVYQYIDATPEESAAVFADYALHSTYVPNVSKSVIVRLVDPLTTDVEYVLRLPVVRDEQYTVRDRVRALADGAGYEVAWTLVRATSVKATAGYARFERYANEERGRDGTLMVYHNFVMPGSRLAGIPFVRSRALHQVRATASAVAAQVERERSGEGGLLARQLRALRAALSP
jgi:hypothetical protein